MSKLLMPCDVFFFHLKQLVFLKFIFSGCCLIFAGELDITGQVPLARGGHTFVRVTDKSFLLWGGCDLVPTCENTLHAFDPGLF
jgi:hypothetical protein